MATSNNLASLASVAPNTSGSIVQPANIPGSQTIAGNFNTFLQLLTTQLQNQNPLDPLDTNQFTQQLVAFSSVEQQVNMNVNLQTLISMQQAAEATSALQFLGTKVSINSTTSPLSNATQTPATWSLYSPVPATGTVRIVNAAGQTVYTGTVSLNSGSQPYSWNGQGSNGVQSPDGNYSLVISATDANNQPVNLTAQVQGVVTAINASQVPPYVTVNGQNYPISLITAVSH